MEAKVQRDVRRAAAGTVTLWPHDADGERISEIGWMVLPEFQGRALRRSSPANQPLGRRTDLI